jgi:hypothetical protein
LNALDVSSNNHKGQLFNWQEVRDAGYEYVYVKATQAANYLNPYLLMDVRDARNAGLNVGVYHFLMPSPGAMQQAAYFMQNGIKQTLLECNLLPVVDVEASGVTAADRDIFCETVGRCAQYMDRSFYSEMGQGKSAWSWIALGGGAVPTGDVRMVQTGTAVVPGIPGVQCDIDNVTGDIRESMVPVMPKLNAPIVAVMTTPDDGGYWEVGADGGVFCFGNAQMFGSLAGTALSRPIVGACATQSGKGYTLVGADGGIFTFGDAANHGSIPGLGIAPA